MKREIFPQSAINSNDPEIELVPRGLHTARFKVGADEFVVFRYELCTTISKLEKLTTAEREVVVALLDGLSNSQIGERRGTSARTVANQIASIFRKLGVSSRAELVRTIIEAEGCTS